MLARKYFHDMAHSVRELPGCGAVLLVLDCPDVEIAHPLVQCLPVDARFFGALELVAVVQDEGVRALCDVACQSGQVRFMNDCQIAADTLLVRSVAIAPVDSPDGVLGYFMLVDACPGEFTDGDIRLLHGYLLANGHDFERNVRALCSGEYGIGSGEMTDNPGIAQESNGHNIRNVAEIMKTDLLSMVSHELRAPLTAIKGYAGLLQAYSMDDREHKNGFDDYETTVTPARQQHYLDIIMDQARYLEMVMSDLLDVSRIQAGKLALRYTKVDLASLCQQVIRLIEQRLDQPGRDRYTLRYEVAPELPPMQVDALRLQQILHNVLDNAVKYSPAGGLIELQASVEYPPGNDELSCLQDRVGAVVSITISDRGIGISPRQQARLFQPFSRLDHPITGQVQGAGLGLYITQKLIEAMQGTIELSSEENRGTCVTLRFPLSQSGEPLQTFRQKSYSANVPEDKISLY